MALPSTVSPGANKRMAQSHLTVSEFPMEPPSLATAETPPWLHPSTPTPKRVGPRTS
ncbi:hypothetical protein E4U54_004792, partial [Claviceps lovelessii]